MSVRDEKNKRERERDDGVAHGEEEMANFRTPKLRVLKNTEQWPEFNEQNKYR